MFNTKKPKTLIIKRHAERDWISSSLTERGKRDAYAYGVSLSGFFKTQATAIFSSPLRRAIQTASGIHKGLGFSNDVVYRDELSEEASGEMVFQGLGNFLPEDFDRVLCITHAPVLNEFKELMESKGLPPSKVSEFHEAHIYKLADWGMFKG